MNLIELLTYDLGACNISPSLLWEYDLSHFDWKASRKLVVQRVIERGHPSDYKAAFDMYGGIEGFREIIKDIPHLSKMDMNFVCVFFNLNPKDLRCYNRRHR